MRRITDLHGSAHFTIPLSGAHIFSVGINNSLNSSMWNVSLLHLDNLLKISFSNLFLQKYLYFLYLMSDF